MADDVWGDVRVEREALAGDLEGLTDEQWATPSLCAGWTVRDVVAHMTATARISPATFFPKLVSSGFSLRRMQDKDVTVAKGATPADTLAAFRSVIDSRKAPPGPKVSWLGEALVHAEDVRQPLGIGRDYPTDVAVRVADFYKGSNLVIGAKRRIAGVRLRATDTDWAHGEGAEAAGPMMALVMVMSGRAAHLDALSGDGVGVLRSRM